MFAGMIPDLARIAAGVTCVCEPRLLRLFQGSFPGVTFVHPSGARVDADLLLAMGSLGAAFRPTESSFPGAAYLKPPEAGRAQWAARLGPPTKRLRVGLSWRGGAASTRRRARSVDLQAFNPALDQEDCEFISLQYGDVQAEIEAANADRRSPIRWFPPQDMSDFADLAGLVANLDIVVSVQTAAVHLAGGLGKPCLVLLPADPEWRYMRRGETMPWYGSVRLIRQATPGDWTNVLDRAAARVSQFRAGDILA